MNHLHRYLSFGTLGSLLVLVGCSGAGTGVGGSAGSTDDGNPASAGAWNSAGAPGTGTNAGAPGTGTNAGAPGTGTNAGAGGASSIPGCYPPPCDVPCGYIVTDPCGGANTPLYSDSECNCGSLVPLCDGGIAGALPYFPGSNAGAPSCAGGSSGAPSSGGSWNGGTNAGAPSSSGGAAGAAPSGGGSNPGGVCAGMSCGALCGYFALFPGGPTQPMMCDASQYCLPAVPYCGY